MHIIYIVELKKIGHRNIDTSAKLLLKTIIFIKKII